MRESPRLSFCDFGPLLRRLALAPLPLPVLELARLAAAPCALLGPRPALFRSRALAFVGVLPELTSAGFADVFRERFDAVRVLALAFAGLLLTLFCLLVPGLLVPPR